MSIKQNCLVLLLVLGFISLQRADGAKVPTCIGHQCGPAEVCYLEQVQCVRAPCPPLPACKPDKCATVRCIATTKCVDGQCVPSCDNYHCEPGEECYLQNVACFAAPCYPVPTCRPKTSCATVICAAPSKCVDGKCVC